MIEARIDQAQRNDFDVQGARQQGMGIEFATKAVAGPETGTGAIDQGEDAGMDRIAVTVARDRNANWFRQRLAVKWRWHPPWIVRIAGGHYTRGEAQIVHGTRNRALHRRELGKKAALDSNGRIECGDSAWCGLERRHAIGKRREP